MKRVLSRVFALIMAAVIVAGFYKPSETEAASYKFKYKNYMTGEKVKYNGTIPSYDIDGKKVNTSDTPGIINDRSIAMCNANVFKSAGVKVSFSKSKGKITFKYHDNKLVLYINSDSAYFNSEKITASCESYRIKYSDSKKKVTLVPSRFVAETLGMSYTWKDEDKTAYIKTPVRLEYDGEINNYFGTLGKLNIEGDDLDNKKYPSVIFSNNAMLSYKMISEAVDDSEFSYSKKKGIIEISCNQIDLKMYVGSTVTYVNGLISSCPIAPVRIKNLETGTTDLYLPGRYVFETLGYSYTWDSSKNTSIITFVDEKTGIFKKDYEIVALYDGEFETEEDPDYYQTFSLPVPDDIDPEELEIQDLIYDNLVRIEIDGDQREFYRENEFENTGEAILQASVLYFKNSNITRINLRTRTDKNNIILGHRAECNDDSIEFEFDRPHNLYDKIIILDAGHGGSDPGTQHGGYDEKDMNFSVVYKYCKALFDKNPDIKVYYSRYDDTLPTLYQRAWLGARIGADFFISVHHNSNWNTKATGTSVYYSTEDVGTYPVKIADDEDTDYDSGEDDENSTDLSENDEDEREYLTGKIMAQMMKDNLVERLNTVDRGIIDKNFVVVGKNNSIPAVLLEIGFMSNPDELKRIVNPKFQKKVAKTIYNTVLEIYEKYGE